MSSSKHKNNKRILLYMLLTQFQVTDWKVRLCLCGHNMLGPSQMRIQQFDWRRPRNMKSLRSSLKNIFTAHQRSCGKVIVFTHVCLSKGREGYDVTSDLVPCSVQGVYLQRGGLPLGESASREKIYQKAITEGHFQPEDHNRRLLSMGGGRGSVWHFLKKVTFWYCLLVESGLLLWPSSVPHTDI